MTVPVGGVRGRAVAVAVVLCLAATGCDDSGDRLETLRTDPMTTYELNGALDRAQTEISGGTSPVSSPSDITTTFTVEPGTALSAAEVVAADARTLGWELEPKDPNGYYGIKFIEDITATLTISAAATGDTVSVSLSSRS